MAAAPPRAPATPAPPLEDGERRRGRRIAISSHPLGMTFSMVFTQHLPTLALVSLGASEIVVGLQSAFLLTDLLKLPTLRRVARVSKRTILIVGQVIAQIAAIPLLLFPLLARPAAEGAPEPAWIALASLLFAAAGLKISETVWFPMLRSYVEPAQIGRFFGLLRSVWHLALIVYYLGARQWLTLHPADFGTLFAIAWLCGCLRIIAVARLPERSERTGARIRVREAVALLRSDARLRSYLIGVTWATAVRMSVVPFVIVMMQREVGFTPNDILYATIASFAGGLASLYPWGHVVDRVGPAPVFCVTAIGLGLLTATLVVVEEPGPGTLAGLIAFFFLHTSLVSGFGVADTRVLFELAPEDAPARLLVIAAVVVSTVSSLAPMLAGFALDLLLSTAQDRLVVYHGFFLLAAVLHALSFVPLRSFRQRA